MQDTGMIDEINNAGNWIIRNQELLISYAVNIVAAIAIIVVGLMIRASSPMRSIVCCARVTLIPRSLTSCLRWYAMALSRSRLSPHWGVSASRPPRSLLFWVQPVWLWAWH